MSARSHARAHKETLCVRARVCFSMPVSSMRACTACALAERGGERAARMRCKAREGVCIPNSGGWDVGLQS